MESNSASSKIRRIRAASLEDAEALAQLETRVWRAAYRGLLPQPLLDGLSEAAKAELWRGHLRSGITTFVLEANGVLVAFAGCGPARDGTGDLPAGEIYAIYVEIDQWGRGHGRALFERCAGELSGQGLFPLVLWVLRQNERARRFYERQGMLLDGAQKLEDLDGHALDQVLYVKDYSTLMR